MRSEEEEKGMCHGGLDGQVSIILYLKLIFIRIFRQLCTRNV